MLRSPTSWYEIRVLRGGALDDAVIEAGESVQRWLASGIDLLGAGGVVAAPTEPRLDRVITLTFFPAVRRGECSRQ